MSVDNLSVCATRIVLLQEDQPLSIGTGFIYARLVVAPEPNHALLFLVTAYYVLTGHSPAENAAHEGVRATFWIHLQGSIAEQVREFTLPLYTRDGQPTWLQSRESNTADVAVLPLPDQCFESADPNESSQRWLGGV